MKLQINLASHGSLAEGMLSAVKMIAGTPAHVHAYGLDTYGTPQAVYDEIVKSIDEEATTILVCDIKCGSIHNQLIQLCDRENVWLISGMNLALVLSLVLLNPEVASKDDVIKIVEESKENIVYFDKQTILESQLTEDGLW